MNKCESFLDSQIVLVARPLPVPGSVDSLAELLKSAGAEVVNCPVIQLSLAKEIRAAEVAIGDINRYGALVFASSNGAYFFSRLIDGFAVSPAMVSDALDVVAIGKGTGRTLEGLGYDSIRRPESADSLSLANWLVDHVAEPYLIVRADRGSTVLADELKRQGKRFREIVVYESSDVMEVDASILGALREGKIHWVTLTSSAIANSAIRLFGEALHRSRLASFSPQISEILRSKGYNVAAEAREANFCSLVQAVREYKAEVD